MRNEYKKKKWKTKKIIFMEYLNIAFSCIHIHSVNNQSEIGHTDENINMGEMLRECDKFTVRHGSCRLFFFFVGFVYFACWNRYY